MPEGSSGSDSVCPAAAATTYATFDGTTYAATTPSPLLSSPPASPMGPLMAGLPSLYWPFVAIGIWFFSTAAGRHHTDMF